VWVELEAEGPIRVLRIREFGILELDSLILFLTFFLKIEAQEQIQHNIYDGDDWTMVDQTIPQVQYKLQVILSLDNIGISIIDDTPQELLYISLRQVYIEYGATEEDDSLELKVFFSFLFFFSFIHIMCLNGLKRRLEVCKWITNCRMRYIL